MGDFRHVQNWVFDLDNTLYPAEYNLFAQIDIRMTRFVANLLDLPPVEARKIQKDYYVRYGTTLSGLMNEHSVKPEDFMDYVHNIDVSHVSHDEILAATISNLPGRKFIFTNGSQKHAANVTSALGIEAIFDGVFDIRDAGYVPKPHPDAYHLFLERYDIEPGTAAMFEDIIVNLEVPEKLGMKTILVCSGSDWLKNEPSAKRPAHLDDDAPHVHFRTNNLTDFLSGLKTTANS